MKHVREVLKGILEDVEACQRLAKSPVLAPTYIQRADAYSHSASRLEAAIKADEAEKKSAGFTVEMGVKLTDETSVLIGRLEHLTAEMRSLGIVCVDTGEQDEAA